MNCASCREPVCGPDEAFTGDVCPRCQHFAHPTRLGVYEDLELIKRGGMGSVYRARHPKLGTTVAIKVVHQHIGPENLAERFDREASAAGRIPHPGVVRVFDIDSQEGRLYLVMELVEGSTLRQLAHDAPRDVAWSLDKVRQLCDVLHAAHQHGVVHRDIKPENVMVDATGKVRVLDFGISRLLGSEERLTQTGEILGTPEYIAPEQILDVPEATGPRTDVYATGVVLYELLTGVSPFAGSNLLQVLKHVESRTPKRPSELRPELPPALDAVVMAALEKDPKDRPRDAQSFAQQLRAVVPTPVLVGATSDRRGVWLAGVVLCVFGGWILGRMTTPASEPPAPDEPATRIRPTIENPWIDGEVILAAQSESTPPERRALARLYRDTLLPLVLRQPTWLVTPPTVAATDLTPSDPHRTLVHCIECLVDGDRTTALEELGSRDDALATLVRAAASDGATRRDLLRERAERTDRFAPTRYYLDFALAFDERNTDRMRAAAELLAAAGAPAVATRLMVSARLWLAEHGDRNHRRIDEDRLARMCVAMTHVDSLPVDGQPWPSLRARVADMLARGSDLERFDLALDAAHLPPEQRERMASLMLGAVLDAHGTETALERLVPALRVARRCGADFERIFSERPALREAAAKLEPEAGRDG